MGPTPDHSGDADRKIGRDLSKESIDIIDDPVLRPVTERDLAAFDADD